MDKMLLSNSLDLHLKIWHNLKEMQNYIKGLLAAENLFSSYQVN